MTLRHYKQQIIGLTNICLMNSDVQRWKFSRRLAAQTNRKQNYKASETVSEYTIIK